MISRTRLSHVIILCLAASPVMADRIAMPRLNPVQGFVQADVVVRGKVKSVEKEAVEVAQSNAANAPKLQYSVAVLDIQDTIKGAGNLTQIRVGVPMIITPNPALPIINANIRVRPVGNQAQPLATGQEGCFFLQKHPAADFFVPVPFCPTIDAKATDFKQQLASVMRAKAVLEAPVNALKVEDKKTRYANLQLLLDGYRNGRTFGGARQFKLVELPAEESKLMMKLIAELPPSTPDPDINLSVMAMFQYLNPLATEGWTAPKPVAGADYQKAFGEALKAWVGDHADTYRVKRFAVE